MSRTQNNTNIAPALPLHEVEPLVHGQSSERHLRLVQQETTPLDATERPSLLRLLVNAGEYGVDPYGNTMPSEQA